MSIASVLAGLCIVIACPGLAAVRPADDCDWERPGQDPYMGPLPEAVDRYPDIPPDVRRRLKDRMQRHDFDDQVLITRDAITGSQLYAPEIRGMHFGSGRFCERVSRAGWDDLHNEGALVYCEEGHCLLVPAVCRNLSRITRIGPRVSTPPPDAVPPSELVFEPPGAVVPAGEVPPELVPSPPTFASGSPPHWSGPPGFWPWWWVPWGGGVPLLDRTPPPSPVPEPATWALLLGGLAAAAWRVLRAA